MDRYGLGGAPPGRASGAVSPGLSELLEESIGAGAIAILGHPNSIFYRDSGCWNCVQGRLALVLFLIDWCGLGSCP